jgi:hypothetical protein
MRMDLKMTLRRALIALAFVLFGVFAAVAEPIPQPPSLGLTASRAVVSDASGRPASAATTATEVDYLSGVTSAVQTQIDGKITAGTGAIVNADISGTAAIQLAKLNAMATNRAVRSDGSGILGVASTTATELDYLSGVTSGVQAQINALRPRLTASAIYYVRTDGSDSNDGLTNDSGGAFLTIQKGINVVSALDLSAYTATVQLGNAGTYSGFSVSGPFVGNTGANVSVVGDTGSPGSYVISSTTTLSRQAAVRLRGVDISVGTPGFGLIVSNGSVLTLDGAMVYGTLTGGVHMYAEKGGVINVTANYTIDGSANGHVYCASSGIVQMAGLTVTVSGTPAWAQQFAQVTALGMLQANTMTYSGSATGKRYTATENGVIRTLGGGATMFPGNAAGTTATGGQYNWMLPMLLLRRRRRRRAPRRRGRGSSSPWLARVAALVLAALIAATAAAQDLARFPARWYWTEATHSGEVYSAADSAWISDQDSGYSAFVAAGNVATAIASEAELIEVLGNSGLGYDGGPPPPIVTARPTTASARVRVQRNAAQAVPSGTLTGMIFDTIVSDPTEMADPGAPDRITVPEAGVYLVIGSVRFQDDAVTVPCLTGVGTRELQLRVGASGAGTLIVAHRVAPSLTGSTPTEFQVVDELELAAGDVVRLGIQHTCGGSMNIRGRLSLRRVE